jgi:hypothetical protein
VISPLLSNLYLHEVDRMLEKAVDTTRRGKSTSVQYARFADDMVILIDAERRSDWLVKAIDKRLREEFAKLRVEINEDKSRMVNLKKGESFTFLGFEYRRILSFNQKWRPTLEVADIVRAAGNRFWEKHKSHFAWAHRKVLDAIVRCRTAALGGHRDKCIRCGRSVVRFLSSVRMVGDPSLCQIFALETIRSQPAADRVKRPRNRPTMPQDAPPASA